MVDYRKTYRNYQSFSKYLIINYYLLFMIHNIRHISISFSFKFSFTISIFAIIYSPRKLKLKYSTIKNAVPSIKIRTPSSISRQNQTCFPVHSHHPSNRPKMSPKISLAGHSPQTKLFVVPQPPVANIFTPTNMPDFAYLPTVTATMPKISPRTTSISWPEVIARFFHTTSQSLHFITHTSRALWNISETNYTSLLDSLLLQSRHQNPHQNPLHLRNPTTHFRATCLTK